MKPPVVATFLAMEEGNDLQSPIPGNQILRTSLIQIRGPQPTEIDSPHLRGGCPVRSDLLREPSSHANSGNYVGIDVGICWENRESDRGSPGPGAELSWLPTSV